MFRFCCTCLLPLLAVESFSQKTPLTHEVYDSWKTIESYDLSPNGNWLYWVEKPGRGDRMLHLRNLTNDSTHSFARGSTPRFTWDSEFLVFMIDAPDDSVRTAKRNKVKKDKQPKDSAGILNLATMDIVKYERVKSYKLPEQGASWAAFHLEKAVPVKKDTSETVTEDAPWDNASSTKNDDKKKGTELIVHNLRSDSTWSFDNVTEFLFPKKSADLLIATSGNDSLEASLIGFNAALERADTIHSGLEVYKKLSAEHRGGKWAFLASADTSKTKVFSLYTWQEADPLMRCDTLHPELPADWAPSQHKSLSFSEDGTKLFFGASKKPKDEPKDSLLDDEKVKVDVWSWTDALIQPNQLEDLGDEKKRTYQFVLHLNSGKVVQLCDTVVRDYYTDNKGNGQRTVIGTALPYQKLRSWDGFYQDYYVVNMQRGTRKLIGSKLQDRPRISPNTRYLVWFDRDKLDWLLYDVRFGNTRNLTSRLPVSFANELHDSPTEPRSYGLAGWTDQNRVLIYDRYDIWAFDPSGVRPATNITEGLGRVDSSRFRYLRLNRDELAIPEGKTIWLSMLNHEDHTTGFYTMNLDNDETPRYKLREEFRFSGLKRAREANRLVFKMESFERFPNLWVTDSTFEWMHKITNVNPQQHDYLWGSVESFEFTSTEGDHLDALLYKPEDYDSTKAYPTLVYFYERVSSRIHTHRIPSPSRSTINPTLFTSNGYVVLMPDIKYRVGHPGPSALACIMPAVDSVVAWGISDPSRVAIQGQSWGGYQVAYLVTQTDRFAAAMAGAPVSNMTSAYGGVRWGSGLSRMFQYERTQSRIGATLWDSLNLYIENSPLFFADQVKTPLLMMHNDDDGAVPWYQGIEYFLALRRLGKPTWMLNYNGDEHNLTKWPNRVDLSIRMSQFFDHYLKDAPAPNWMTEGVPALEKSSEPSYE